MTRVTDLLKIFCHILAVPTPPAPPSSVSECANKGFQASVGKREGKAEVKDGRGGGTTEARDDRGPTDKSYKTRRSRAGGGRGELLDGREPMGGSRPPRRTHSARAQRFSGGAPPQPYVSFGFDLPTGRGRGTPFPQCSGACRRPSLPPPLPLVEEDGGRRSGGFGHPAV